MASRYLKIPVYQVISERDSLGNVDNSYSKILKTLRVPQEMLVTTTGSPYVEGLNQMDSLIDETIGQLENLFEAGGSGFPENYPISTGNLANGAGMWIQVPMKTNKYAYNSQINVQGRDKIYNSSLWLRVSQEVQFENVNNGKSLVIYTYPFVSSLTKSSGSEYIIPYKQTEANVGSKDFHIVYKMLQERLTKALSADPGSRETLLDFGTTDGELEAGKWNITWAGDPTGSTPLTPVLDNQISPNGTDIISLKTSPAEIINKKSRLLVTCAAVSNLGQVTEGFDSQKFVYPTLNETWNIMAQTYESYSGQGNPDGDQTVGLNNSLFTGPSAGIIFNPDNEIGNIDATKLQRMCEFWSVDPAKGGGKFPPPEGPVEEGLSEEEIAMAEA
tara:strand:- start:162 stop:1325 length:1164 start_codon:yes stop_codon:yes gene_type:complete